MDDRRPRRTGVFIGAYVAPQVRAALLQQAADNGRNMSKEIEYLLTQALGLSKRGRPSRSLVTSRPGGGE